MMRVGGFGAHNIRLELFCMRRWILYVRYISKSGVPAILSNDSFGLASSVSRFTLGLQGTRFDIMLCCWGDLVLESYRHRPTGTECFQAAHIPLNVSEVIVQLYRCLEFQSFPVGAI